MSAAGMVKILAPYASGPREEWAAPTPTPGLVITEDSDRPGHWIITHQGCGAGVADLPDPETALHVAVKLGEVGDWTRTSQEIRADEPFVAAWRAFMDDSGLYGRYCTAPGAVPAETLRQIETRGSGAA